MTLDRDFYADPYPVYARWREEAGAHRVALPGGLDGWVITGYAESRAALADPRLRKGSATETYLRKAGGSATVAGGSITAHMLNSDPPDHTRLRKLVNKAFTPRRVAALRPRIERIATELLDAMSGQDTADLIEAYALPLPIRVICDLLGVPPEDRARFHSRGRKLMDNDRDQADFFTALQETADYLTGLVRSKRENPADDLLSALVQAQEEDDRLTDREVTSMAFLLLVAGHETTVNLIANGTYALLREPGQLAALRADPSLLPGAVEEFLRYEGPVNIATLRYTAEPVTIGGTEIPAGEFVHIALIAANRDPERFADQDRLDITRDAAGHLAFGHGIHHCLGAPLARLEAEIAFGLLLSRFPGLHLAEGDDAVRWQHNIRFRGLSALQVRLR